MKRKKLLHIVYFIVFILFFIAEKQLGIRPFSLAFFMALVYCRQNTLILCPSFAIASMIITPTLQNLIFALLPCAIILLAHFAHYKSKKKIAPVFLSIYTFMSQIPLVIMYSADVYQLTNTIISLIGVQLFMYCCIAFLYPLLTRGLKYRLRHEESLALFIFAVAIFIAISYLQPWGFCILPVIGVFIILTAKQSHYGLTMLVATAVGLGGTIAVSNHFPLVIFVLLGLIAMGFKEVNIYLSALATVLGTLAILYFFNKGFELLEIIPYFVGAILIAIMPRNYFKMVKASGAASVHNFATRTLANRDRNQIAKRLLSLSKVFYEIQDILKYDLEEKRNNFDDNIITKEVVSKCCNICPFLENCAEKMGETVFPIAGLVRVAMTNGKATLLDTPAILTNHCKRVNTLLNTINDIVARFRKKQQVEDSIEQGREMIIAQMGGVGLMLDKLSQDMQSGICYDTVLEKRIFEELCRENIIANDIIVYGKDRTIDRIMLNINENDAEKKVVAKVLSHLMACKMMEIKRERSIKNNVILHFILAPKYDVIYGDMQVSKEPSQQCGDNKLTARISEDKLMLILADGMGSGQRAYNSSMNAISMIESFYKAGFDHSTVLACVGRLLGLREEEEFNALDIVVIDTRTGQADFIKQGGRESFIFAGGAVEVINCGSLPLGIVEDASPIVEQRQLANGDIFVLASDGVLESLGVDLIKDILITSNTVNPQIFAELLVNNAQRMAEESGIRDDMSCLVGRMIKQN